MAHRALGQAIPGSHAARWIPSSSDNCDDEDDNDEDVMTMTLFEALADGEKVHV